jgi:acyl-CoA synthetase (NDP forming)
MSTYRLNNLLLPRSVALVGPSPREGSVGRAIAGTFSKLTSTVNSGWSTRVMPRSNSDALAARDL